MNLEKYIAAINTLYLQPPGPLEQRSKDLLALVSYHLLTADEYGLIQIQ